MNNQLLKRVLIISLILNLFLMGGLVAGAYKLFGSRQSTVGQNALGFASEGLSETRQHEFKKLLRETRHDAKPLSDASKDARAEVRKLLAASGFDREAIKTAIDHVREADIALRMRIEVTLLDYAETLTQEERVKLAEGLAKKGPLRQPPKSKDTNAGD